MTAWRRQLFLLLNRAIGSRCGACYRELLAWERLSRDEILSRRQARLSHLLQHAAANVPFYREHVAPGTDTLDAFPVLRRETVNARPLDLMSGSFRSRYSEKPRPFGRYGWLSVTTGGSSGSPTTVIHERDFRDFDRAARLYAMTLCGFPFGTPYFRLWGSTKDIAGMRGAFRHRLVGGFAREVLLNAFRMEDGDMTRYLARINGSRIRHLMAYVDAAYELARHAQRNDIECKPLDSVMACGGTVSEDIRAVIESVFQARVHNKYGSRDCGDMACECPQGGLHIFANRYVIETVDDNDTPVPPGETGRLLITVLGNAGFPLIRYDIGDMGALSDETCSCGRGYPLLARIEGRPSEFLRSTTGGHVSPVYVRHLLGVVHNTGALRRFQLVQEDAVRFSLALQWAPGADDDQTGAATAAMLRDLQEVLGPDAVIAVERVARIPEAQSGKFFATIRR